MMKMPAITHIIQHCCGDFSQCTNTNNNNEKVEEQEKSKFEKKQKQLTKLSFAEDVTAQKTSQEICKLGTIRVYLLDGRTLYNN